MRAEPFVVTVASEKGGVGKTTIATNLAVYLKALREDLPVTIASFDNHFSIDQMFAIGRHRGGSVAALFAGQPAAELARLGEYGVQFLTSERELHPPDEDLFHLRRALAGAALPGLLILDTRPVLDYFTRNALLAADLVLVPVKDRASLVNAASLQRVLAAKEGDPDRMWILPSLVDARLRLRPEIGVREFLTCAAQERGYQVLDTWIAKSPKVEGLATGFSARVRPVLTDARGTIVHRQFRDLAAFVLERFDARPSAARHGALAERSPGRMGERCPVCAMERGGDEFAVEGLRRRWHAFVHAECLESMLAETDISLPAGEGAVLALRFEGAGVTGPEEAVSLHLFDPGGMEAASCRLEGIEAGPFLDFFEVATETVRAELYREVLLVFAPGKEGLAGGGRRWIMEELLRR